MKKCLSFITIVFCLASICTSRVSVAQASETMVKQENDLDYFNKVILSGGGNLVIEPSSKVTLKLVGNSSCVTSVNTEVQSDTLIINRKNPVSNDCKLTFYLGTPELAEVEQNGGGKVLVRSGFDPVDSFKYSINGGGTANMLNLKVSSFDASVRGGGTMSVHAEKRLNVNINGGGSILYRGAPEVYDDVSGGGTIKKLSSDTAIEHGEFTDTRNNRTYKTVKIEGQEWLAENFAYLPYVCKRDASNCGVWVYDYDGENIDNAKKTAEYKQYGALYSWSEAKKLAPDGWRLPSDEDWQVLERHIGIEPLDIESKEWRGNKNQADKLKVNGTTGLNVVFGGWMTDYGKFNFIGEHANFWCSNQIDEARACERMIGVRNGKVGRAAGRKGCGFSVRYVRDVSASTARGIH